ncbi:hypothetical protein AB4Y36_16440 [Paraburkholderia sp. BR10936]|uniref:hypothetical protein n=1 Tax=Paraburkholderia sp. BR10936 TaxID=3236993 RepID=UPI0034D19F55
MDEDVGVLAALETGEQSSVAGIVDRVARGIIEGRLVPATTRIRSISPNASV